MPIQLLATLLILSSFAVPAHAQAPEAVKAFRCDKTDKVCLEAYIRDKAQEHGISGDLALSIATKESNLEWDAIGDMDIICDSGPNKGKPVRARGIYQITQCYFAQVPDSVAFDPILATDFVMNKGLLEPGMCESQFSTC